MVAGGLNGCTLHYINNDQKLMDGDLLLIDAGAEWDYYTADITRTWPVNGKFSQAQLAVYNVVLDAQQHAIRSISPGITFEEVHLIALSILIEGLKDLGVLKGSIESIIEKKTYAPYYMHATSHWLGLDVHDAGIYRNSSGSIPLEPGMVLTVEPGLYFGKLAPNVPDSLKEIGIRIEDNILVTDTGYENLSEKIPNDPNELENLIGTHL
ncbi:MAG: Xaa-Pro dipeptidase [SAR202 cluster bacterium]|nr:Xaa-Pro dipeptidase [SAR202 cluster bacterium]